jgi:hypothetical protein
VKSKILKAALALFMMATTTVFGQTTSSTNDSHISMTGSVSSFDFPGATNTQATAITPSGDIVGRYTSPDGAQHGFLRSGAKFRPIDFAGASSTDVTWINSRGQIVGDYLSGDGTQHGFLLSGGRFTTIDYPNAQFTAIFGIDATGEIVGIQHDSGGTLHGFLLREGRFSSIDFPGATGTIPAMISGGLLVGGYLNATGLHGFSLDRGLFKTIDCPGATFTFLSGVNPQAHIVGGYGTPDGNGHGVMLVDGNCIRLDFPGATNTYANGINPQGDTVGRYTGTDGIVHGFLLRGMPEGSVQGYSVGVDYHAYGADFVHTAFITIYNQPNVRQIVREQLQGMADRGATTISTRIWFVTEPGTTNFGESWRATFPMTKQEQANLHAYAQDVAAIRGFEGNRLRLDICLLWLGASDYSIGTPATGLGFTPVSAAVFTSRVQTTTDKVLTAIAGVNRPDGVPVAHIIYMNGGVLVGATPNEEWFMTTHYPRFVSVVTQAGFTPAVYFSVTDTEDDVLQNNYVDVQYPILNNHRSMFWVYRAMKFMVDQGLPLPARIDFAYYVPSTGATYPDLLTRVLDDADATLPSLGAPRSYGAAETFYFLDNTQRYDFGQAFAAEAQTRSRLRSVTFWTTPDGGGAGVNVAYPFAFEDYLPPPGSIRSDNSGRSRICTSALFGALEECR